MIESILQGLGIFFYWVGIIICILLAYIIPTWGLTRYERKQLRNKKVEIEASKAGFAKQVQSQEIFNKAQNCMNSAYQKQTEAMAAYKAALTAIDKASAKKQVKLLTIRKWWFLVFHIFSKQKKTARVALQ